MANMDEITGHHTHTHTHTHTHIQVAHYTTHMLYDTYATELQVMSF